MTAKPNLRVVKAAPPSVEDELRALFRREATLARELADVRAGIAAARARYMAKHRTYGMRVETLRGIVLG